MSAVELQRALADLGVTSDTLSDDARDSLDRNGYAVFESLMSATAVAEVRDAILELEDREDAAGAGTNPRDPGAIRIDDVNHKGAVFDQLWLNPVLLACMQHYLGDFRLSSVTSRAARPGMGHQNMHVDYWGSLEDGYVACNSGWMLDDFKVENGATRVVPGSHLWGSGRRTRWRIPGRPGPTRFASRGRPARSSCSTATSGTPARTTAAIAHGEVCSRCTRGATSSARTIRRPRSGPISPTASGLRPDTCSTRRRAVSRKARLQGGAGKDFDPPSRRA